MVTGRSVAPDCAQVDVDSGNDLKEVGELRPQRQMRLQLLDVDVDLVDVHLTNIDEDVRLVTRLAAMELRVDLALAWAPGGAGRLRIAPATVAFTRSAACL